MGDGADRGSAVRPAGCDLGLDARSRPGAGRDDGRGHHLVQTCPGSSFDPSIFAGGETFASKIANNAAEFDTPEKTGAYIAAGLVLFILTFIVNAIARYVIDRRKEFAE